MTKIYIFSALLISYFAYSLAVYTRGTDETASGPLPGKTEVTLGKRLYQEKNCSSCHQLYGLGGYLGPELTTAFSDPNRGELYLRAFLQNGGPRMPKFDFTEKEINSIISYLEYIDHSAISYRKK
ncbi:MAG: cytochrome c [Sphingobacteriales bacterium]|nr:cytochrome c [Sphingobacteriales bacterium]